LWIIHLQKFFSAHPTYISPAIVLVVAVVNVDVAAAPATVATAQWQQHSSNISSR